MCNFFEEKFEQINKFKYLMTLAGENNQARLYKEKIEDIFKEFQSDYIREETTDMLILTKEELANFNGKNGNLAYVAVNGVIYDVTNEDIFKKSPHNSVKLGTDITKEFKECHNADESVLAKLPIVGNVIYNRVTFDERCAKEVNINELSNYNGKDGKPPYIAIFGTVYDLTDVDKWQEKNIKVGCDLTGQYKEVYGNDKSHLKNLKVAGVLTCSLNDY